MIYLFPSKLATHAILLSSNVNACVLFGRFPGTSYQLTELNASIQKITFSNR